MVAICQSLNRIQRCEDKKFFRGAYEIEFGMFKEKNGLNKAIDVSGKSIGKLHFDQENELAKKVTC